MLDLTLFLQIKCKANHTFPMSENRGGGRGRQQKPTHEDIKLDIPCNFFKYAGFDLEIFLRKIVNHIKRL